jgi:type IV pilus assembly protein PilY1
VLLAGGHDPAQDRRHVRRRDRIGAALYLVDAFTGRLLWRAGGPSTDGGPGGPAPDLYVGTLDYAIAATPRLLDLDGDGELDRAYVADTGGQVFRFEFTSGAAPAALARAVLLASLGGPAAADRRFYAEPDVVAVRRGRGAPYAAITLGSGFAPDPLAAGVADRLYSLRDVLPDAWRRTPDPAPVTDEQLTEGAAAPASRGWKRRLDRPGQRILVPARTIDHAVYVPSWLPPGGPGVDCVQPEGSNRLHVVDVRDGRPAAFRVIEAPDEDPEAPSLGSGGIAPPLTLVRRRADAGCAGRCPEDVRGLVGATAVRVPWPGAVVRAGWAERGIE